MNSMPQETEQYTICSENYFQFIQGINGQFKSPEALVRTIAQTIAPLAQELHIGYLSVHFETHQGAMNLQEKNFSTEIYKVDYDTEAVWNVEFATVESGICVLSTASVRNYTWNVQEREQVRFLLENLFVRIGHIRVSQLLAKAVTSDFLTEVLNIRGITIYGNELQANNELGKYNALYMNIKNFKYINKSVGHTKGDEILRKYCKAVQSFLLSDEKICRPGGDNFVVLIQKDRTEIFLNFMHEIPVTIAYQDEQKSYRLASNIGIYRIAEYDTINNAIEMASIAMNEVKHTQKGIDQLWYDSCMIEKIMHDKQISQFFPKALADGEFLVYYQPKVTLDTKELCGCEALTRWFHHGKIVPPMDFIPILEREGTICNLDFYVFERVCADLRRWLDMGIEPVRISVNFSQQHLRNTILAEEILRIIEKYQIDSRYIEIELTEMSCAKDHDSMLEFLQKMRECGICTSIDDFGTGFSSLNMLREFHMDVIKLDKSFVDKIALETEDCSNDRIVIQNIVNMVRDLDLEIISEGVETKEQAEFLKQIHCNMAQGYLFDRPLPHDEFEQRLVGKRYYSV